MLSVLLQRTMRAEEPAMEGRLILGSIFDTSFGVLSGMHLLHEDARLRSSGLVTLDHGQEETGDVLESRFRLSEDALASFRAEVEGTPGMPRRVGRDKDGYQSHRDFLIDLRALHNLYQLRSERVFGMRREGLPMADSRSGRSLTQRIESGWKRVRLRLAATVNPDEYAAVRLLRECDLDEAETMIVVHLLFSELYDGEAFADIAELLRLVSANEGELLRNRRYVLPTSNLRRRDILLLEPFIEGRDLTGEAHLADWAVNDMLDLGRVGKPIATDERLDWHLYLKRLEGSSGFFRDLDKS